MKKAYYSGIFALLAALLTTAILAGTASAHGHPEVGKYHMVIGFLDEPAYQNIKNGLDLAICDDECKYVVKDGQKILANPVEGVDKTLNVQVIKGNGTPLDLKLQPRYANPGKYSAYFMPTESGDYTFRLYGTIGEQKVDQKYTSGPGMFSAVNAIPTYPKANEPVKQATNELAPVQQQLKDAQNSASTATTIGIVGALLGVLGLAAGGFALARKPEAVSAESGAVKTHA